MKKIYLLILLHFILINLKSQTNPWLNCDPSAVIATFQAFKDNLNQPSNGGYVVQDNDPFPDMESRELRNNQLTDTCIVIDMSKKCPHLGSGVAVLLCFDANGKHNYTTIKSMDTFSSFMSTTEDLVNNLYDHISGHMGSSNSKINFTGNVITFHDRVDMNEVDPYNPLATGSVTLLTGCDTCVKRILGDIITDKYYPCPVPPCPRVPCVVSCGAFVLGPLIPPVPPKTLVNGSVTATGSGNGKLTYSWSFGGSPLSGGGANCPDIDMENLPGGGLICVTITNWLPDGTSCSCDTCIGVCYNVSQPFKMSINNTSTGVSIFPSPAKDKINLSLVSMSEDILQAKITDISGREFNHVLYPLSKGVNKFEIDLKNMASGIYYLNIQSKTFKETKTFKKD